MNSRKKDKKKKKKSKKKKKKDPNKQKTPNKQTKKEATTKNSADVLGLDGELIFQQLQIPSFCVVASLTSMTAIDRASSPKHCNQECTVA